MEALNKKQFYCFLLFVFTCCQVHNYKPINHYAAFTYGGKDESTEINLKEFPEDYSDINYFKFKDNNLRYKLSALELDSFSVRTGKDISWFYRKNFNDKKIFVKRIPSDSLSVYEYKSSNAAGFLMAYVTGYTLANLITGSTPSANELVYQPLVASKVLDFNQPIYLIEKDSALSEMK